jgi:hypothetical protein
MVARCLTAKKAATCRGRAADFVENARQPAPAAPLDASSVDSKGS